ncbi:MAG: MBL fold metallo-hydrolase RNA specificity domain-containing protein, partial [Phycisphaerae bacterium]
MQIKLMFLGAAQNVTGSRYLLQARPGEGRSRSGANGTRLLVDCGLYQERQLRARNWDPFPTAANSIDAVLLTHAHLDHCGLLPKLVREGFKGKIYCTAATSEIAQIILLDSAKLQEEDAEFKRKRHEREGRKGPFPEIALYTKADAEACFPHFSPVQYKQSIKIGEGVEATFYDAGHVLGSSIIKVKVRQNERDRSVLFSGDIGRPHRPIVHDPTSLEEADYILVESTYGDRIHQRHEDTKKTIAEIINTTRKAGGNIIIPSFALERSQEVLYYINELLLDDAIPHIMVFLDSPMAMSITKVFQRHSELFDEQMSEFVRKLQSPFNFPGLKIVETTEQSKAINNIKGTVAVIAGSGMCTGGRIKYHLVNNISRPESTIMFVGYQANGTLGRRIVSGEKQVRILGQEHQVKARVVQVSGFSAHADRDELFQWLTGLKKPPRRLFVVHGESESAQHFGDYVSRK